MSYFSIIIEINLFTAANHSSIFGNNTTTPPVHPVSLQCFSNAIWSTSNTPKIIILAPLLLLLHQASILRDTRFADGKMTCNISVLTAEALKLENRTWLRRCIWQQRSSWSVATAACSRSRYVTWRINTLSAIVHGLGLPLCAASTHLILCTRPLFSPSIYKFVLFRQNFTHF